MKIRLPFVFLTTALIAMIGAALFKYVVTREILAKASVFNISEQLSDLHKWQKWNKALFNGSARVIDSDSAVTNDGEQIKLINNNPASFTLLRQEGNLRSSEYLGIEPVKADTFTLVRWSKEERGYTWLAHKLMGSDEVTEQLEHLKKFTENPDLIYGFPIRIVRVTDPILCTIRKIVDKDSVKAEIKPMLKKLNSFLFVNHIPVTKNYYYTSYFPAGSKVELAVALPVNKELPGQKDLQFLKFPEDGRLLVGTFHGCYTDLHNLYLAMDKYMTDHNLTKVAQVLEAYPFSTTHKATIDVKVIYPIY